jgi:hypothetical protein
LSSIDSLSAITLFTPLARYSAAFAIAFAAFCARGYADAASFHFMPTLFSAYAELIASR